MFPIYSTAQAPRIDTLRLLVDWKCNLTCSYCCNEIESIRQTIKPVKLEEIKFEKYDVVCISGGEPLLFLEDIRKVCEKAQGKFIVLYTNGTHLNPQIARRLVAWKVNAVNVGLHIPASFDRLIRSCTLALEETQISLRFQAEDKHQYLVNKYPAIAFKFWKMNDCDKVNEDRVVLKKE